MDIGTIIGLIVGFILVTVFGVLSARGNLATFIDPASFLITMGGTISATLVSTPMNRFLNSWKFISKAFFKSTFNPSEIILTLVSFSEKARREGLLALEDDLEELDDEFMKKGLQLVVDGTDPALVQNILYTELENMDSRHTSNRQMLDDAAGFAPAFGMIGTLIGLVIAIASGVEDRTTLLQGLATALITTYYGAILANLVFLPISNKLRDRNSEEMLLREIMIHGILAIQSGDNPRIVKDRLVSFLPPALRAEISEEVEPSKR
jgi:chemotaxis protein MotA